MVLDSISKCMIWHHSLQAKAAFAYASGESIICVLLEGLRLASVVAALSSAAYVH